MMISAVFLGVVQAAVFGGPFIRGDSNGDLTVDLSDAVATIQDLFLGGPALECRDAGDFNDDGTLDIADISGTLNFLFLGGDPAPNPSPRFPRWDPTPDDPFKCGDFPDELVLDEEEMFDRLTRTPWVMNFWPDGTCYIHFRRDGSYSTHRSSDSTTASSDGKWNFKKTTDGGGMLSFEVGEFIRFSFMTDGSFWLAHSIYEAVQGPICCPDGNCCETCTRSDLPDVPVPAMVDRLVGRWRRTDDFNTFSEPVTIQFGSDGSFQSGFREGICIASGFWSLFSKNSTMTEVFGDTCDLRDGRRGGPTSYGSLFRWEGEILVFGVQMYLPDTGAPAEGRFRIEVGSAHLSNGRGHLEVTYPRPLAKSVDRFRFVLRADDFPIEPWRLSVTGAPLKFTGDGFILGGDPKILNEIDVPALAAGGSCAFNLDLDLRGNGELGIEFEIVGNQEIWLFPSSEVLSR